MQTIRSIKIPDEVRPGQEVRAAHSNAIRKAVVDLIRWCADNEVITSADIGVKPDGSSGKLLFLKRHPAGGGGVASGPIAPWTPSFFTEGEGETLVYKCRFNLGTVNQVVASNWNTVQTLSMAEDAYHFVVLTVTTASGKVTGVSISVDASAPTEDSIAKDTPPVSFKIVLGAIGRTEAKMIVLTNLEAAAEEVFRESDAAPATGAEPFHRWWRWNVDSA